MSRKLSAAVAALLALFLLASCETLAKAGDESSKPEAKKTPTLTEGQLQEKYIALRAEGRRLLEARRYGPALDAFLSANDIRANSAEILLGVGQAYLGLEYWERAKTWFDRYLAVEKDRSPDIYRMIAHLYGDRLEYFDLALKVWTKAVDASVAAPVALDFWYRGGVFQKLGRRDEAVEDYRTALDLAKQAKDEKLAANATNAMAALAGTK